MFGISFYEFLVILVIAVLVLKPKDFISTVSNIIKMIRKLKEFFFQLETDIEKINVLNDFDDYVVIKKVDEEKVDEEKADDQRNFQVDISKLSNKE